MKNLLVNSFIIHSRPYRETSMIYDILTLKNGFISVMGKGIKKKKDYSILQPTKEMILSFTDSNFPILTKYETIDCSYKINRNKLLIVLYFNELIYKLVPRNEPQESLFILYRNYMQIIRTSIDDRDSLLLGFETLFLKEIGYELSLSDSSINNLQEDKFYTYYYGEGFKETKYNNNLELLSGKTLN